MARSVTSRRSLSLIPFRSASLSLSYLIRDARSLFFSPRTEIFRVIGNKSRFIVRGRNVELINQKETRTAVTCMHAS